MATFSIEFDLTMSHTVHRMMTESTIRPFDWWMLSVEILVLLFVAYEAGLTFFRQIADHKRTKMLRHISDEIRHFIDSGETLRSRIRRWNPSDYDDEWVGNVTGWTRDVEEYLRGKSPDKALIKFQHIATLHQEQRKYITFEGDIVHVGGNMGDRLQIVSEKLNNLHEITERIEDFF